MSLLDDVFSRLKTSIVGTKTASIDTKLDSAAKDIVAYRSQTSRNNYIELIKNLVTKTGIDGSNFMLPQGSSQGGLNPALFGQAARVQRYHMYEAITANISYCHRALRVLVDNILAPDDITKSSLEIKPKTNLDKDTDSTEYTKTMREFLDSIKLEDYLDPIIKNSLHMGDFFCEIADDKTALMSKSAFLTEANEQFLKEGREDRLEFKITESQEGQNKVSDFKIILDYSAFDDGDSGTGKISANKIKLLYYEPKRIIKLQSSIFPICFGYLVFPLAVFSPQLMVQDQTINTICGGILKSLEKKVPNLNINTIDSKDLIDTIRLMVRESDPSRALNIRYVPPDKMQHFMIPSTKYYPYGESIFDPCQFASKVLIALETAVTIHRINRSIQKRKIAVEIGLPRDAKKAIERLKEEFRKRKISMDSFGSVDTIPSMVTSFEDIYLPQKDGKAFVDITPFDDAGSDTGRGRVEELKFMRDSIVATLMVPPSFLAIEENLSNKSALSEENILFARTIVNHQKYFTNQIQELITKIYRLVDPEKCDLIMDNVSITLPSPKSLQFERESKYTSDLANLVQTLETIGVPREWAKRKYLTSIDWAEVDNFKIEQEIDKNLKTGDLPPEEGGEMGTGLGGMGGISGIGGGMGGTGGF